MVGLYMLGIVAAMTVAWVIKRTDREGARTCSWNCPPTNGRTFAASLIGVYERAMIFMKRVGTVIMALTIVMWALATHTLTARGKHGLAHRRHVGW